MSAVATSPGTAFGAELLEHLAGQIESARRLLAAVLAQGAAIRARDVETVLRRLTEIQGEMNLRATLDEQRARLLIRAAAPLGVTAPEVTLEGLATLVSAPEAERARALSAELHGLLHEVAREHACNRALMRQELAFLDHLTRLIGAEPATGYRPPAERDAADSSPYRVLNIRA